MNASAVGVPVSTFISVTLVTVGGSAFAGWLKENVIEPQTRSLRRRFLSETTIKYKHSSDIKSIGEMIELFIKKKCKDEFSTISILNNETASEDSLVETNELLQDDDDDANIFEISVPHLRPVKVHLIPGVSKAVFFYVQGKGQDKDQHGIIAVFQEGGPTFYQIMIPEGLRSVINLIKDTVTSIVRPLLRGIFGNEVVDAVEGKIVNNIIQNKIPLKRASKTPWGTGNTGNTIERELQIVSWRHQKKLVELFIQEARRDYKQRNTSSTYIVQLTNQSRPVTIKAPPRPMGTIAIEPGSPASMMKESIKKFFQPQTRKDYALRNWSYQKSFLLYGPPGNGKSSIILALSLQYSITYYILSSKILQECKNLRQLNSILGPTLVTPCILVIEDAESFFASSCESMDMSHMGESEISETNTSKKELGVNDFIDCIRGQNACGRIIFFTTNTIDKLDGELLGFVNPYDQIRFPNAGRIVLLEFWKMFFTTDQHFYQFYQTYENLYCFPGSDGNDSSTSTSSVKPRVHSVACMQRYCSRFRGDPIAAALEENIRSFDLSNTKTMKHYWLCFYDGILNPINEHEEEGSQEEQNMAISLTTWGLFLENYDTIYRSENKEKKVHNLNDLHCYLEIFRKEPKKAASKDNVLQHFAKQQNPRTKKNIKSKQVNPALNELKAPSVLAERSMGLQRTEATKILNQHVDKNGERDVKRGWKAIQMAAQEKRENAYIKPYTTNMVEYLSTIASGVFMTFAGLVVLRYFPKLIYATGLTRQQVLSGFLVPPLFSAFMSYRKQRFKNSTARYKLDKKFYIGSAVRAYFKRRLAYKASSFSIDRAISTLRDSYEHFENASSFGSFEAENPIIDPDKIDDSKLIDICVPLKDQNEALHLNPSVHGWHTASFHDKKNNNQINYEFNITWEMETFLRFPRSTATKKQVRLFLQYCVAEFAKIYSRTQKITVLSVGPADPHQLKVPMQRRITEKNYIQPTDNVQCNEQINDLISSAKEFEKSKNFYRFRGIPYRRGYLITGPKQSGKLHTIKFLASQLGRDINIINLAKTNFTDATLVSQVQSLGRSILVLQNIDFLVSPSGGGAGRSLGPMGSLRQLMNSGSVTYSGILNLLDGPMANTHGLIIILTARNYDQLISDSETEGALLRPGRVSLSIHLSFPTRAQIIGLFEMYYPHEKDCLDIATKFVENLKEFQSYWYNRACKSDAGEVPSNYKMPITIKLKGGKRLCFTVERLETIKAIKSKLKAKLKEIKLDIQFNQYVLIKSPVGKSEKRIELKDKDSRDLSYYNIKANDILRFEEQKSSVIGNPRNGSGGGSGSSGGGNSGGGSSKLKSNTNDQNANESEPEEVDDFDDLLPWWNNTVSKSKKSQTWFSQLNWRDLIKFLQGQNSVSNCGDKNELNVFLQKLAQQQRQALIQTMDDTFRVLQNAINTPTESAKNRKYRESCVNDARFAYLNIFSPTTNLATLGEVCHQCPELFSKCEKVRKLASKVFDGIYNDSTPRRYRSGRVNGHSFKRNDY
jgi:uncharacterized membrane protein YgcG